MSVMKRLQRLDRGASDLRTGLPDSQSADDLGEFVGRDRHGELNQTFARAVPGVPPFSRTRRHGDPMIEIVAGDHVPDLPFVIVDRAGLPRRPHRDRGALGRPDRRLGPLGAARQRRRPISGASRSRTAPRRRTASLPSRAQYRVPPAALRGWPVTPGGAAFGPVSRETIYRARFPIRWVQETSIQPGARR